MFQFRRVYEKCILTGFISSSLFTNCVLLDTISKTDLLISLRFLKKGNKIYIHVKTGDI